MLSPIQTGTQGFGLAQLSTISLGGQLTQGRCGHCYVELLLIQIGVRCYVESLFYVYFIPSLLDNQEDCVRIKNIFVTLTLYYVAYRVSLCRKPFLLRNQNIQNTECLQELIKQPQIERLKEIHKLIFMLVNFLEQQDHIIPSYNTIRFYQSFKII